MTAPGRPSGPLRIASMRRPTFASAAVQGGVSAGAHHDRMPRRQRQLDELRRMCDSGAVARATDLAFAHFADFGPDHDIVALLAASIDASGTAPSALSRFAELRALCSERRREVPSTDADRAPR